MNTVLRRMAVVAIVVTVLGVATGASADPIKVEGVGDLWAFDACEYTGCTPCWYLSVGNYTTSALDGVLYPEANQGGTPLWSGQILTFESASIALPGWGTSLLGVFFQGTLAPTSFTFDTTPYVAVSDVTGELGSDVEGGYAGLSVDAEEQVVVPEPATLSLLIAGACAALASRRERRTSPRR